MESGRKLLGELLVEWGLIERHQLEEVLALQQSDRRKLGVLLVERGHLGATKLTQLLSHQFSLPFVSLARVTYTAELVAMVPGRLAHQLRVVPICTSGDDVLFVATDDPTHERLAEELGAACGREVRLMVAAPTEVQHVIDTYYAGIDTERPAQPKAPVRRAPSEPTGAIRIAVTERPAPPPVSVNPLRTGAVVPSAAPRPGSEPEVVELSPDDFEFVEEAPVALVIGSDERFVERCRKAAEPQDLRIERATLVTSVEVASRCKPIAIVLKEETFAVDRVGFTKLSMQQAAHLVIWSDDLDGSYLEALFAAARTSPARRTR